MSHLVKGQWFNDLTSVSPAQLYSWVLALLSDY